MVAQAREQAAKTEANAQAAASRIYGEAYRGDPGLYTTLRSLDAVAKVVGKNTTVVLRTDAAPFRALIDANGGAASSTAPSAAAGGAPPGGARPAAKPH
jgi:membrane protease subunit HflC